MAIFDGTDKKEVIFGYASAADWIYGRGGDDTLYGLGGNDYLKGGGGADHLVGGADNDTAAYTDSTVGVMVDLLFGTGSFGTAEGDTLYEIENVDGSYQDDRLYGDNGPNTLAGLVGDDKLFGRAGDDILAGNEGDDVLKGGGGHDRLNGGSGIDTADYSDTRYNGVGVNLQSGEEHYAGNWQWLEDTLIDIENVIGSTYNDSIIGDGKANKLDGGAGGDILQGGSGNDRLIGGPGSDWITGGPDGDTFVWNDITETNYVANMPLGTLDLVKDFNFADGDRIDLTGIDADIYTPGNQAFVFIGNAAFSGNAGELRYYYADGNTILQMQTGHEVDIEGAIVLTGIHTPTASWFVM